MLRLLLEVSIEELRKQYLETGKMDPSVFDRIVATCQNRTNWATWMMKKVTQGIIVDEDIEQWQGFINTFERYKVHFKVKDINTLKTADEVADFAHNCVLVQQEADKKLANSGGEKLKGSKEERKREVDRFRLPDYESLKGDVFEVFKLPKGIPENQKYAIELGTGTTWCTASRGNKNYYSHYNSTGPLYIFINKSNPKEKYQIHIRSNQFKNVKDLSVDIYNIFYLDFYKYLQKTDNIEIPRDVKFAMFRETSEEFTKTHNVPEMLRQRRIDFFHLKGVQDWYKFNLDSDDDVKLLCIYCKRWFNRVQSSTKSLIMTNDANGYYFLINERNELQPAHIRENSIAASVNWSDVIHSKEDYLNVEAFLRKNNDVHVLRDWYWNKLVSLFDDSLLDSEGFFKGMWKNYRIYYIPSGQSTSRARIQLHLLHDNNIPVLFFSKPNDGGRFIVDFSGDPVSILSQAMSVLRYEYEHKTGQSLEDILGFWEKIESSVSGNSVNKVQAVIRYTKEYYGLLSKGTNALESMGKTRVEDELYVSEKPFTVDTIKSGRIPYHLLHMFCRLFNFPRVLAFTVSGTSRPLDDLHGSLQLYLVDKKGNQSIFGIGSGGAGHIFFISAYGMSSVGSLSELSQVGLSVDDVCAVADKLQATVPGFIKRALTRKQKIGNGKGTKTVSELLRSSSSKFKICDISIIRPRVVQGIEGTWSEFGPSIMRSSSKWGPEIDRNIVDNNYDARVVLYWAKDGYTWNMYCVLSKGGVKKKIWLREGSGEGCVWRIKKFGDNVEESFNSLQKQRLQYLAGIL